MKAALYCVAARKENAVPFPSFLFLSCKEQTAALALEMQPQLIPSLWAWVTAVGNIWWELTSLDFPRGWRGCWEGCTATVNTQSLICDTGSTFKAAFSCYLKEFYTWKTGVFIPSHLSCSVTAKGSLHVQQINCKKKYSWCDQCLHGHTLQRGPFIGHAHPAHPALPPTVPSVSLAVTQGVCLQTYCDTLKHITSCLCSWHSFSFLPKKKKKIIFWATTLKVI